MNKYINVTFILIIIITIVGCEKDSAIEDRTIDEEHNISNFISEHNLNMTEKESGLFYMDKNVGNGMSPEQGDFVIYEYNMRLLDSTLIFTTDSALAKLNNIYDSTHLYGPDKRQIGRLTKGENEALTLMKENGYSNIIVPFKLGFGEYNFPEKNIPPYSTLLYDLYLKEVIKDPVLHEKQLLNEYLLNNIDYNKIADGVYYKKILNGNDLEIALNNNIDFQFTIKLLDGRHISTDKKSFLNGDLNEIRGLNLGISKMKDKEKGIFIIRSDWAFGYNENLLIPPYSTITVDVEILKVY